ncbi:MAG: YeeE/YedE family protein [Phycisphaerales bacterium]|nr:YeeE/YedE family protein [Phycisphaerales bacterium]MCB9868126.1 YeeE/YedE family protein [Phycisphaerales bacterium]
MFEHFFADPKTLLLGALTGLVFGFLLQKGGVTQYNVIVNQFRFKDFTVLKTMLTAIVVGAIGIYAMLQAGLIGGLSVKAADLGMNAVGGAVFGVGMVLLGYCPGTALAAVGQGSRDAAVGVAGAIVGAGVYAEAYPVVQRTFGSFANFGKITFAEAAHTSPWWFVAGLALVAIGLFVWLERRESPRGRPASA